MTPRLASAEAGGIEMRRRPTDTPIRAGAGGYCHLLLLLLRSRSPLEMEFVDIPTFARHICSGRRISSQCATAAVVSAKMDGWRD